MEKQDFNLSNVNKCSTKALSDLSKASSSFIIGSCATKLP